MKASERKVALNTILLSSTELITKVVSLFLVIMVARRLGPENMGIYAFALTLINLFDVFVNFGLDRYIQREIGRRPDLTDALFARVFALKLMVFSLCAPVILILGLTIVDSDLKRWVVWILSLSLLFRANVASSNCFFRAHQKAEYEAVVVVGFRLTYGVAGLVAILSGYGLIALAVLELTAQAGACVLSWRLFSRKIVGPAASTVVPGDSDKLQSPGLLRGIPKKVRWKEILDLARSARTFLLIRVVLSAFASVNMIMLSLWAGDVVTGFFSAALRLTSSLDFLPQAFTGAFLPVLSRQTAVGWNAFSDVFRTYFRYVLLIGLGIAAMLGGLAENIIGLVFGSQFQQSIPTLGILGLTLALDFCNNSLSNALIALDKEGRLAWIFSAATVANICLNVLLIPYYQQNGAAWAGFLSEFLVLVLQFRVLGWRRAGSLGLAQIAARPLAAALSAFVLCRLLVGWELPSPVGFLVMPPVFVMLLVLAGALSRGELAAAASLLSRRRKGLDEA